MAKPYIYIYMLNQKQKHSKDLADAVNSTMTHMSRPKSRRPTAKSKSHVRRGLTFRSALLRQGQPNSEVPCLHRNDPVILQQLN